MAGPLVALGVALEEEQGSRRGTHSRCEWDMTSWGSTCWQRERMQVFRSFGVTHAGLLAIVLC
jgi:hypothetical protein